MDTPKQPYSMSSQIYVDSELDIFRNLRLLAEVATLCPTVVSLSRFRDQTFSDKHPESKLHKLLTGNEQLLEKAEHLNSETSPDNSTHFARY